ncbi:MAG: hypothetical protein LUG57_10420 [Oscillospiraceae bacterium]|nr:hypothetical protein [Oscillospiraceae bacterium]
MRIKVAAAAPEIIPGQPGQNMANVLAAISRARADGAAMLVLPDGVPEDINHGAVERQAGPMPVYPLTAPSLTAEQLLQPQELDILCCSSNRAATASSYYENEELAAMASHENMAVVIMACPLGGEGQQVYTGQCVIAQNGFLLASSETGYALAEVSMPRRGAKSSVEETVTGQPTTPWTVFPEMLPRILNLQSDALARRMRAAGTPQLTLSVGERPDDLLALCVCAGAVDRLRLSRKNIHAEVSSPLTERVAARLGVSCGGGGGLSVASQDLTARALEGAVPEGYAVNAALPRGVSRLVLRAYANTCGDRDISIPLRAVLSVDETPWALTDFLLYCALVYDLPRWANERLLEDAFQNKYSLELLQSTQESFFKSYHKPTPCDGPVIFSVK